ncbi:amidohydrolase family protein [Leptospira broomii serovar Hurstbridge str. 5399]|uniref:Amidohydrolase family protein n=1 Tax=Leptospira broomii serovar Hurstbridge str. 5399 TaxID=1049789 RepID=T0GN52_9LEPT|nr:amidohydrolase family protein [Leptospira broomii]EQA46768.1 amidohydrolase family protein [Leptospira broomii serovar Hurstbridge str. 5399]
MSKTISSIDVHHHFIPSFYTEALEKEGIRAVAGAPLPSWTPLRSLNVMDINGIRTAITSISSPGVYFGNVERACALARRCNEYAQEIGQQYSGRFGSFAILPMPLPEKAAAEAVYALDTLKADGVVILASTRGKFLGDPDFEELMTELNTRNATVFVHPDLHPSSETLGLRTPGFILEFLCDTTRAAVNLIYSGTLEKYPRIKWILAHAGGFLPYVAWRVSLGNLLPEIAEKTPHGILTYIRRFYFDTALSPSPFAMAALKELVDPGHILFGSDFPFAPEPLFIHQREELEKLKQFDAQTLAGVNRGHALKLFPRWALDGETIGEAPKFDRADLKTAIKFQIMKRFVTLASKVRNR